MAEGGGLLLGEIVLLWPFCRLRHRVIAATLQICRGCYCVWHANGLLEIDRWWILADFFYELALLPIDHGGVKFFRLLTVTQNSLGMKLRHRWLLSVRRLNLWLGLIMRIFTYLQ